ncbi:Carbamoyl-phosphate synthase large chain [bioreactor metagenome]|uniref:Carbamoyl-phosphate synthase large chain n=1 Tax=bioreactor metagenome TaxID=1076179 RepID=A0A645B1D7_9ZZZZ
MTQFGGRTADKLAAQLKNAGVKFIGTSPEMIGIAENREKLNELLDSLSIPHPPVQSVFTLDEALAAADNLGYPVLVRTSCADGVQNKIIAYNDDDIREYIKLNKQLYPLLIYKYLSGKEAEVDAISDGENILIPGIMEHIERAGIHSGDSISVYPSRTLSSRIKREITDYTEKLATALKAVGLLNIQFVVYNNEVYVIKVNLRASRTVPYIGKVTGIPMVELAVKCALGQKLTALGYGTGLYPEGNYIAVKVPVFSFDKLRNVDTLLGPDMKSTGEALGIAITFEEALHKGLVAAGLKIKHSGGVLITVRDQDKQEIIPIAEKFADLGFSLYATARTARTLNAHMVAANSVRRIGEPEPNIMTLIDKGKINYIISTSNKGRLPQEDDARIRMKAVERSIPCLTAIDTASALVKSCLKTKKNVEEYDIVDITKII